MLPSCCECRKNDVKVPAVDDHGQQAGCERFNGHIVVFDAGGEFAVGEFAVGKFALLCVLSLPRWVGGFCCTVGRTGLLK